MALTVAVLAMGEMGAGVAGRLIERGAQVLTSLAGRSEASAARAKAAGVEVVQEAELVERADMLLSIVPPSAAAATAGKFLPLVEASSRKPLFIDANAIAPSTLHAVAQPYLDRGLRFGDASIIGLAPRPGYTPRVYISGPVEAAARDLEALGLETRLISDKLGDASALKMAYGGVTKGLQAIGTAMALGAARAGVGSALVEELSDTQPQVYAWLCKTLPLMYAKAYRWDDEMLEISRFLEPERGAADMLSGAAALYRHVAEDHRAGANSEIIPILDHFVRRPVA